MDDSWDALQWIAANASFLSGEPTIGIIVGGTSAGANITVVLRNLASDTNMQPPLTGQCLSVSALPPADVVPGKYQPEYLSLARMLTALSLEG
jgi:acetyl esterase/lipase